MRNDIIRVMVGGSYQVSDGYPNVKWLLEEMERSALFSVEYAGDGHNRENHFSRTGRNFFRVVIGVVRIFWSAFREFIVIVNRYRGESIFDIVYVPYPSIPLLLLFSILPKKYRPLIVADVFISIYDTLLNDRKIFKKGGFFSGLIYKIERRALHTATRVLTDTECNRRFLEELFSLPERKAMALPLATDETNYLPRPYHNGGDVCTVLFIGTFVPLHGAETVAQAALLLADREDIRFRVFGNGQTAEDVLKILEGNECNLYWQRDWVKPSILAREIEEADICLGIFGNTDKAARVWPLKNYAAMRVGRAVVSEHSLCLPGYEKSFDNLPFSWVPPSDAKALARRIVHLAENSQKRKVLSDQGRRYYSMHLSNAKMLEALHQVMSVLVEEAKEREFIE